jgi:hypothetical protein
MRNWTAFSSSPRTNYAARRKRLIDGVDGGNHDERAEVPPPPGWDETRVREVLAHYEGQTEDEQLTEIEAAGEAEGVTMMAVPTELVPEVRALLAKKQSD